MQREPFVIFKRTLASGNFYYYYYIYDETGKRRYYSTGKRNKTEARLYCLDLYKKDILNRKSTLTFAEYTQDWYIYDKCPYIQGRLLRGHKYSKSYAKNNRANLEKHILPYFGDYTLNRINAAHIESWLLALHKKGYKRSSINNFLIHLKLIMKTAYKSGILMRDPSIDVEPLATDIARKGTLTPKEVNKLFYSADSLSKYWKDNKKQYLFNLIAMKTGMRLGEITALTRENLFEDHIVVKHSWNRRYGLGGTKTGKERIVPITKRMYTDLITLNENNSTSFIFCNSKNQEKPLDVKTMYIHFWDALHLIGISEEERKNRNVTFHSYRYLFNSTLRAQGVPDGIIRAMTGHSSEKMTDHYTEFGLEDLKRWMG